MSRAAYIVGVGETVHAPKREDANSTELAWEAIRAALDDAGLRLRDIQGVVTASQDFWEGRTISSMSVNEVAGATLKPESKVAGDGALALLYAAARIEAGADVPKLVVAHCLESQANPHAVELAAFDPYVQRALDPDETVIAGLQAGLAGYDLAERARVVVAARRRSPWLPPIDAAEVESSPVTSSPLRRLERAPLMDGACAVVLCDEATAIGLGRPAIRVMGAATATDPYWSDRDLTRAPALSVALASALVSAGWADAPDRIELSAPFAHQALLWARELGIDGDAAAFEDGALSATGGCLAGRPGIVAGLSAAISCAQALRDAPGRAIAHGTTGLLGQSHHLVCLEAA